MNRPALQTSTFAAAALVFGLAPAVADAQSRVQYGRITNAVVVTEQGGSAATVGTILGGTVGLASGSGQSGSNRALRTVGGAAAGRGIGNLASRSQAFEYTVLIGGTQTIRVVSDQAGKRVGDCVAVETGQFSNIRLVPDARCNPPPAPRPPAAAAPAPAPRPPAAAPVPAADQRAANACDQAKLQVLNAETDEAFALAERRMRLLCGE
jgi:outer membrane lipoprotein SlyB